MTLDLLKQNAEDVHKVCEAAQLKRRHSDESVAIETFDPAVSGATLIDIFFSITVLNHTIHKATTLPKPLYENNEKDMMKSSF